jgi:cell division protein FtsI (penicillin-binding protein 3)
MVRRRDSEPPDEREPRRRSGIGDARAFSPRGRTTRDGQDRPTAQDRSTGRPARDAGPDARDGVDRGVDRPRRGGTGASSLRVVRGNFWDDEEDEPRPARRARPARLTAPGRPATRPGRPAQPRGSRSGGRDLPPRQRAGGRPQPPESMPQPPRMGEPRRRLRLASALALLLLAVIGVRLVQVQLSGAPAYAAQGLKERLDEIALPAPRGTIRDRDGAVLAYSVEARYIAADPELVADPQATARALSPMLGRAGSELVPLLEKKRDKLSGKPIRFVFLARGIDIDDADKIRALKLPGIVVDRDERRDHPGNDLAANLLGFTGTDLTGLAGIEARFDDTLRGRDGKLIFEVGQGNLRAPIPGGYRLETPAQPGTSMRLTIDRDVQFETQRILKERMDAARALYAAAVVLDVQTGEVIAQASYPTYNADNWQASAVGDRQDVATSKVVEPGSVHKLIVLSAALQEGVIAPDSTVQIGPSVKKGDTVFDDTHPLPAGTRITLPGLMAYSSNVATIAIADQLGAQKLYDYQKLFGLGQPTGIGVPGESPGLVQPPENWSATSYGSIPVGHGVSVTALQMAAAYAAVANDGVWIQPHLVLDTVKPDGTVVPADPPQTRRVISAQNAAALRTIMEAVVSAEGATGRSAAVAGFRVAGKTGTGKEIVNGRISDDEVTSFIGMAPAEKPRYVIAVFAHTPKNSSGGAVAAPAFRQMMNYVLRRFEVLPSLSPPPQFTLYQ